MNHSHSLSSAGGPVAIRGFLVQTLACLLDIARPDWPFTEITLEPAVGDEQFDFLWKDAAGSHATQVKSTIGSFTMGEVQQWANKLAEARTNESCRLILVGNIPPANRRASLPGNDRPPLTTVIATPRALGCNPAPGQRPRTVA